MHIAQIVNELGGTLWEMVFSVACSGRLSLVYHALEAAFCVTGFVGCILQVVEIQWFIRLSCLPIHAGQMHIAQIVNELTGTLWRQPLCNTLCGALLVMMVIEGEKRRRGEGEKRRRGRWGEWKQKRVTVVWPSLSIEI